MSEQNHGCRAQVLDSQTIIIRERRKPQLQGRLGSAAPTLLQQSITLMIHNILHINTYQMPTDLLYTRGLRGVWKVSCSNNIFGEVCAL